jgi:hypothetical protein
MRKPGGGWHWNEFFEHVDGRNAISWGGPGWIESTLSFKRIEEMRKGDHVVAYQAGEGVLGFGQLASDGYTSRDSDHYNMFNLRTSHVIALSHAVPFDSIKLLPHARDTFEFMRVKQGTVFGIALGGFEQLVAMAVAFNTHLSPRLLKVAY